MLCFSEKSIYNLTDSGYLLDHRRDMYKKSQGNIFVLGFIQGIWFHSWWKDCVNTTCIWSPKRNIYCYTDALQKHKSNGSLSWWWHWILWHGHWSLTRGYINTIYGYNPPRLCTLNVTRSNKKQWFPTEKGKKQTNIRQKLWQRQTK